MLYKKKMHINKISQINNKESFYWQRRTTFNSKKVGEGGFNLTPPVVCKEGVKSGAQPELFLGRGGFVKLGHVHKHFIKNSIKKVPQGKIL